MGGMGSGNWLRLDNPKPTVESCHALDVGSMVRDGCFRPWNNGKTTWSNKSGEVTASIGWQVQAAGDGLLLKLNYHWNSEPVEIPIPLLTTRPRFGGRRWWFTCPLIVGGVPCNRRVGKLYLYGRYFGCRHCHGLTYRSSQQAHQAERQGFDQFDERLQKLLNELTNRQT